MVLRLRLWTIVGAVAACVVAGLASRGTACPFCKALVPTLSQLRERASVVALAELETQSPSRQSRVRIHRVFVGAERLMGAESLDIPLDVAASPGGLLLIFGSGPPDRLLAVARSPSHGLTIRGGAGQSRLDPVRNTHLRDWYRPRHDATARTRRRHRAQCRRT